MINPALLDHAVRYHARHTPDAPALSVLGTVTTYETLNSEIDRIAACLLDRGVQIGDRIVLCTAKGLKAIAALHAILRVGGVYAPLDPTAPAKRIAGQVSVVSPKFVLADTPRLTLFAGVFATPQLIDISQDFPEANMNDKMADRQPRRSEYDAAYILMTSGTTGTPKGIVHTHKSGLAITRMAAARCRLTSSDRISHHTPLHFDMSIFDVFCTFLSGACCVVIPEAYTKLPASLSQLTEHERISVWYSVPHAIIQMVERGALADRNLQALRIVMFAGEAMPPSSLSSFSKHAPNATFLNAYGPTETNHCTTAEFTHADLDGTTPLPIGFPEQGVIVRIGAEADEASTGELLIASDQVMSGYLNAPDLNRAAFCTLPDESGQPRQFYRTGDIVRRAQDGQLILVGRKDRQVKLRGYRIELDEVELALVNCAQITEAAVILFEGKIQAFATGQTGVDLNEIRSNLETVLPHYAVPSRIDLLSSMPRTSTGKINRQKLIGIANAQRAA
ncbi:MULTISPECIES: amino acid adenylation domain-containing protein [unclassified Ruegeria]|uniref:amino acid adenylation domain-containing protein n=1 Tax=unclassified Ruegeria TaxID=2625375 RepID=UPI00148A0060|nr:MULTISPECIES: amino acid adenylation domain-containing protein [unclassified Ruegeria]